MITARSPLRLAAALALLLALPARAGGGALPPVELVQTAPVETTLAAPGIPHARDVWLAMARGARESIDLGQFYVANAPGSDLEPVIAEIERAAARGVKVRLIVSDKLLSNDPATLERFRAMKGAEVRVLDLSRKGGKDASLRPGGIIHAKTWIVDRREAFVGSQNFDWRALAHIHELGLRIRDPRAVDAVARIFDIDWALAGGEDAEARRLLDAPAPPAEAAAAAPEVEVVASPPALAPRGVGAALDALRAIFAGAKESIAIQLLDYSPRDGRRGAWAGIDEPLRAAAARGVKVRLLVSHWNTEKEELPHLAALSRTPNVEVRVVTIPEAKAGFIPYARVAHAKYMVVDGALLWVGTSNWARDYFERSRNVEVIVRRADLAEAGAAIFERVWGSAYAAPFDPERDYPEPRKK